MSMIVEGHAITDAMIASVERHMQQRKFSSAILGCHATAICAEEFNRPLGSCMSVGYRLADRLIQRHRKAGNLTRWGGGGHTQWTWRETPSPTIDSATDRRR